MQICCDLHFAKPVSRGKCRTPQAHSPVKTDKKSWGCFVICFGQMSYRVPNIFRVISHLAAARERRIMEVCQYSDWRRLIFGKNPIKTTKSYDFHSSLSTWVLGVPFPFCFLAPSSRNFRGLRNTYGTYSVRSVFVSRLQRRFSRVFSSCSRANSRNCFSSFMKE